VQIRTPVDARAANQVLPVVPDHARDHARGDPGSITPGRSARHAGRSIRPNHSRHGVWIRVSVHQRWRVGGLARDDTEFGADGTLRTPLSCPRRRASSTPRLLDAIATVPAYWIARSSRAMTASVGRALCITRHGIPSPYVVTTYPDEALRCHARAGRHPVRRDPSIHHSRLGVLDRPVKPDDDTSCVARCLLRASLRGAQRRSNPESRVTPLDCFASLAMTSGLAVAYRESRLRAKTHFPSPLKLICPVQSRS
jgi:hypothetical protein